MKDLIELVKSTQLQPGTRPFFIYSSVKTQHLLNVPLVNPLLIVILEGEKHLGKNGLLKCNPGDFIFLSNSASVEIRNIPKEQSYLALLIEFNRDDFSQYPTSNHSEDTHLVGKISLPIEKNLTQLIEWSLVSPPELWALRKKELLALLIHLGYEKIISIAAPRTVSANIHQFLSDTANINASLNDICRHLAMSESTLRRRLSDENTSLREIKDQLIFGKALHLVQTSRSSVSQIANDCGYESASRFANRFKHRFGITPSELRKSLMADSGEELAV